MVWGREGVRRAKTRQRRRAFEGQSSREEKCAGIVGGFSLYEGNKRGNAGRQNRQQLRGSW